MKTTPRKFIFLIAAFVGIQGAIPVWAAVNMISVEHRVWGDAGVSPTSNSYDVRGSGPLERNTGTITSNAGYYYASSSTGDWAINTYRNGTDYYANAYAQNTYVFNPFSRELSISLRGLIGVWWFENNAKMTLTDITSDSVISIYQSPSYTQINPFTESDMYDHPINWHTTVQVNPEHRYELILFGSAHRGEGGDGSASLNLTLAPEPSTTLLAGIAVLLMCSRRQRPVKPHPAVRHGR